LASRDLPAARRGPRMRQDRRRLCGSPLRHKRANGPARAAAHALGRQNRASGLREPGTGPSILRRRDTHARQPTAQRRNRLRFAPVHGYWRSILPPNNNWLGSRPICGPSFGRADPQFNPFEASPAAWRCSPRCGWPRPTSPSARLMSLRWRQPVLDPLGFGFLDGVQVDQRGELGPFLFDRDQQFIERDVVHVATDVPGKAHRR
jgi:hypothetical protein